MRAHPGIGTSQAHLTVSTAPMTISVAFHEPVRWDGWLLYTHESTQVGAGMSYVRGAVHTEQGELIASFAQEALIRPLRTTDTAIDSRVAVLPNPNALHHHPPDAQPSLQPGVARVGPALRRWRRQPKRRDCTGSASPTTQRRRSDGWKPGDTTPWILLSHWVSRRPRTTTLRLIPNIVVLPYRNPFVVAKSGATLDLLSGGRFTLAVGVGYLKREFAALGVDYDERAELFEEALQVIRAIWTTDDMSFEGRHFTARGITAHPRPVSSPHPPIWIGGNTTTARQRVAQYGDGWCPFPARRRTGQDCRHRRHRLAAGPRRRHRRSAASMRRGGQGLSRRST